MARLGSVCEPNSARLLADPGSDQTKHSSQAEPKDPACESGSARLAQARARLELEAREVGLLIESPTQNVGLSIQSPI